MDNAKFYEAFDWGSFTDAEINVKNILKTIPEDVQSIIDVGCGNGLITYVLSEKYTVLGVDRSQKALAFVNSDKLLASCDKIPVANKSFDLVLCSEVLEHLPDDVFYSTINELDRIANKYILISVPNQESINKGMIRCPKCQFVYHRNLHMRSFNHEVFAKLYPTYELIEHKAFGLKVRQYNSILSRIKHNITLSTSWIPWFWTKNSSRKSFCPNCEIEFENKYKFNFLSLSLDIINILMSSKKEFWLMVLLKRKEI